MLAGNPVSPVSVRSPKLFVVNLVISVHGLFACVSQHKVALCQLAVTPDKDGNIARARARVEAAADAGAKLVVLPASRRPLSLSVTDVFAASNHKSLTTKQTESVIRTD